MVGNFNALSTVIEPLIEPFGYTTNDSSICGGLLVVIGIIGAGVYSDILNKYKNYK